MTVLPTKKVAARAAASRANEVVINGRRSLRRWLAAVLAAVLALLSVGASAESAASRLSRASVQAMEARLNALGYLSGEPDGTFDADTQLALQSFQQATGLEVTGQPDDATLDKLEAEDSVGRRDYLKRYTEAYRDMAPMQNGDINNQVQVLQRRLGELGYYAGGIDGVFGDGTQAAVRLFQMANGLEITGIADGMTLMRLMADVPITWQSFLSEMSATTGDAGLNVYVLQKKLSAMGYFMGDCTGNFSDLTLQAVRQFQADNGLEETGIADADTWALIYSGAAVTRRRSDVMTLGDTGDRVTQLQQQLAALGYFSGTATGTYDYLTETAVRLFQMANELPSTGNADAETFNRVIGGTAKLLSDAAVQESFSAMLAGRSDTVQTVISGIAGQMLGQAFKTDESGLYPGFALVQYVCVAAGLPVVQPETLIRLTNLPVSAASEVEAGNVVAIQSTGSDSVTMLLAIGTGDGRAIYATADTGWVVMSYIDQFNSTSIYRWAEGMGNAE